MVVSTESNGTWIIKKGLVDMLHGGVIMAVTNPQQAKIAEKAGASALLILDKLSTQIRASGEVARMVEPISTLQIIDSVTIPCNGASEDRPFCRGSNLTSFRY